MNLINCPLLYCPSCQPSALKRGLGCITGAGDMWSWLLHRCSGCGHDCFAGAGDVITTASPVQRVWSWLLRRCSECGHDNFTGAADMVMNMNPEVTKIELHWLTLSEKRICERNNLDSKFSIAINFSLMLFEHPQSPSGIGRNDRVFIPNCMI